MVSFFALALLVAADPAPAGSIQGRVTWAAEPPDLPPVFVIRQGPQNQPVTTQRPWPNAPAIDPASRGIGQVAIMLQGPSLKGAWTLPPVTVECHDERPMIRQGDGPLRTVGFVERNAPVALVSRQPIFHALRARGAAFWTLMFPDPDCPLSRRFEKPGLVELSSGAGHYWTRGYLWVCDHPFVTLTGPDGRFELRGVPEGEYELTAWLPHWQIASRERDPESTLVTRVGFEKPWSATQTVRPGGPAVTITWPKAVPAP